MTATKACGRHAAGTSRTREKSRRPKAANDTKRAKSKLEPTPPAALPALPAPDGAGGALEETLGSAALAPASEADSDAASHGAGIAANKVGADPAVTDPNAVGPWPAADRSTGAGNPDSSGSATEGGTAEGGPAATGAGRAAGA